MKKIVLLAALVVATALTGCKKNEAPLGGKSPIRFTTQINGQTRASGTTWDAADEIGIYMIAGGSTTLTGAHAENVLHTYTGMESGAGVFEAGAGSELYFPTDLSMVDFVAYYPHNENVHTNGHAFSVNVTDQTNPAAIDFLFSNNAKGHKEGDAQVHLGFEHKLTKLVVDVTAEASHDVDLTGAVAKIEGMQTTGTFNLSGTPSLTPTGEATVFELDRISSAEKSARFEAIVLPATDVDFTFTLTLANGQKVAIDKENVAFEGTKVYEYTFNVTNPSAQEAGMTATISDWITGPSESWGDLDVEAGDEPAPVVTIETPSASFTDIDASGASALTISYTITNETGASVAAEIEASAQSWIIQNPVTRAATGSLSFNILANESAEPRSGKITLVYGQTEESFTVTQQGAAPEQAAQITGLSTESLAFVAAGEAKEVVVTISNPDAQAAVLTAEATLPFMAAVSGGTVTVTAPGNNDQTPVSGTLTVSLNGVAYATTVALSQEAASSAVAAGPHYEFPITSKVFTAYGTAVTSGIMSWSVTSSSTYMGAFDGGGRGQQVGSGNGGSTEYVLTGTGYEGGIVSIDVPACAKSGATVTVGVTVGGVPMSSDNASMTISGSNAAAVQTANFTSATPLEGDVVITYTLSASGALYLNSVSIN